MARSTWSGAITITVGGFPVPIPVKAYTLKPKNGGGGGFKQLCPCHSEPIKQHKHCPVTDEVVAFDELVKGVARGTGKNATYVALDEDTMDQLASLSQARSAAVDIYELPDAHTVPWHLATARYRLIPEDGAEGSLAILWNGLLATGTALITEWIKRAGSPPKLVAIRADEDEGLTAVELPYFDEVNEDVPEHDFAVNEAAMQAFAQFAESSGIKRGAFDHEGFENKFAQRRAELVEAALEGEALPTPEDAPAAPAAAPDLMALMQASLAGGGKPVGTPRGGPAAKPAPKPAAKPAAKRPAGGKVPVGSWLD